jgi:DNA repair exonuclease SbcCD ATPase subunit
VSDKRSRLLGATAVAALIAVSGTVSDARAAGRIICWKDESGKIVGCGDRVPPEFQGSATKELDSRGITRKTTETPEEAARRQAEERKQNEKRAEDRKRLAEQQRRDRALLATYGSEREIDERRDRELELVEDQIKQLDVSLRNANERRRDLEERRTVAEKDERLARTLPALQQELDDIGAEQRRLQERITSREKDMQAIRSRFDEQKQRYRELKGGASASADPPKPY